MSSAIKILPHYTYEEYCLWEGRWELIYGIPYAINEAFSPKHQLISANISFVLSSAVKKMANKRSVEINTLQNSQYQLTTYSGSEAFRFVLEDDCKIDVELNNIWE